MTLPLQAQEHTPLSLGTATKGGGFQLYGQHLAEVMNSHGTKSLIKTIETKGSKQNLSWLREGKVQLGLVEGNAAVEVLTDNQKEPASLRVFSVMYPNPGMFVVRADSPYRRIEDLKGKPVAFGTQASGLRILARDILDGLGLNPEKDFQQVILDKAGDGPRLVLNKQVESLWGAGIGWPGFVKVAAGPNGARFIAPTPEQIKQIRKRHPHLRPMTVPAQTYQGQNTAIDSLGLWSLVLVRDDVSADKIYQLAKALHQGEAKLAASLQQGSYTSAVNTLREVEAVRLHPGVVRYYQEAGLLGGKKH